MSGEQNLYEVHGHEVTVQVFIYTLTCPVANKIRYIGKTIQQLEKRLRCHLSTCLKEKSHRANWIKSLRQKGFKPVIELLDVCDETNWKTTESYWIAQFKEWGFDLVNQTLGGDGAHGRILSRETKGKISQSLTGKKQSQETIEKRARQLRGRKLKPEYVEKSRLSRIGLKMSPERLMAHRISMEKRRGIKLSDERKKQISENQMGRAPTNNIPISQFSPCGDFIKSFTSCSEAARELNVNPCNIRRCVSGKKEKAHGFLWKKLDI